MAEASTQPKYESILKHLRNPMKLRFGLTAIVALSWYYIAVLSLGETIDRRDRVLTQQLKRQQLARDIETLKKQVARFQDKLPKDSDPNEWLQFLLAGSREYPIQLSRLDTEPPGDAGPFKVVKFRLDVGGAFHDVEAFLAWIEDNPRLLRIDSIQMAPAPTPTEPNGVRAQLVVLGLMGQPT